MKQSEKVKKWFQENRHLLDDDLFFEESIENFEGINTEKGFNDIVGNPKNWNKILSNRVLYEKWVLPNAIRLFGKSWFDHVKWKAKLNRGAPSSLFSHDEKKKAIENKVKLEDTIAGRAKIADITNKVDTSLKKYLEGGWYEKDPTARKKPGGYIIDSLKNEFSKQVGEDCGYKLRANLACPYCLSKKRKVKLVELGNNMVSCPNCYIRYKNMEKINKNDPSKFFIDFNKVACICISNSCEGKYIPVADKIKVRKNKFYLPENTSRKIYCPYCDINFFIQDALNKKTGFKGKGGYLTSMPEIFIWEKPVRSIINDYNGKINIADSCQDTNYIYYEEKTDILIDEVLLIMSGRKPSFHSLFTECFYEAIILWMSKYPADATKYLFDFETTYRKATNTEKKKYGKDYCLFTKVERGKEMAIHQAIFRLLIYVLENNLHKFAKYNIQKIEHFKQIFCYPSSFSGGPMSTFSVKLNSKLIAVNNTSIRPSVGNRKPRLGKIISVKKGKKDLMKDIIYYDWNNIRFRPNNLKPGDLVRVRALMISGHQTNFLVQRIARLKKSLRPIIDKILFEEEETIRDNDFWNNRQKIIDSIPLSKEIVLSKYKEK